VFNGVGGKTNIFGVAREKGYAAGHGGSLEGFQPNQKAAWWDFMGITGRAAGGPLRKGQAAVVGERGPELIIPQGDVDVLPNSKLRMLAEGTNPTNLFHLPPKP
jgi:SLT domain-containing protein